ncbi:hypothetical protein OG365_10590 [Streptomyces sp. NBC_00853]|uniref:hypothetical protein n=1 Tax=unclassified Streptomyces TaxID=2593676 RepID=UPI002E294BBC|nr:hypothetical protein [Streptomyces sp. NBC_01439]WTA18473.1 hypothetical protein OG365_10590 [Streptomyces sp. NBC_00853]
MTERARQALFVLFVLGIPVAMVEVLTSFCACRCGHRSAKNRSRKAVEAAAAND